MNKSKGLRFAKARTVRTCTVNGRALCHAVRERHGGVQVHSSFKVASLRDRVVKKAFSTLAFIVHPIEYRSWDIMLRLYRMLVRPLSEY